MNKLPLIIQREYLAKVRNKSFVIMTFLSPILIVGMIVLIAYLTKVNDSDKKLVAVFNESNYFQDDFLTNNRISFISYKDINLDSAKDSTEQMGFSGLLYIPSEENLQNTAQRAVFYSKDAPNSMVLGHLENVFQATLRKERLQELGVSDEQYESVNDLFEIQTSTYGGEMNLKGINELKAFFGGAFGYLIMMFIIIYGGFVMRSVIEEKTSRIIELIISSVKPFQLMLGKIIGTSLAGLTQFCIWIISASLLLIVVLFFFDIDTSLLGSPGTMGPESLGSMAPAPPDVDVLQLYFDEVFRLPWLLLIVFFVIYFILGYLIYSSIYAAIGAAVDNETDTQQFIFPIILPLMLAIYVGFFSVFNNPHGPIAVGFSLFPLTSPIVMLMRLPGGIGANGVPVWQLLVSLLLLIVTFVGIVWLAAKIYRVGILMYGKKPSYKELYKWLKY
ncbi:MAG: ABC transporter permease [Flavobacteriaceae bacterium]